MASGCMSVCLSDYSSMIASAVLPAVLTADLHACLTCRAVLPDGLTCVRARGNGGTGERGDRQWSHGAE